MKIPSFFRFTSSKYLRLLTLVLLVFFSLIGLNTIKASATYDQAYFYLASKLFSHASSHQVIAINIDHKTISAMGLDALSSDSHIQLLNHLNSAACIAFDLNNLAKTTGALPTSAFIDAAKKNGRVILPLLSDLNLTSTNETSPKPVIRSTDHGISFALRELKLNTLGTIESIISYRHINGEKVNHIALEALQTAKKMPILFEEDKDALFFTLNLSNIKQYSYIDILNGKISDTALQKKIIFIGSNIFELSGKYRTSPFNTNTIHRSQLNALITQALIDGNVAHKVPVEILLLVSCLFCFGMIFILMLNIDKKWHQLPLIWLVMIMSLPLIVLALTRYWIPLGDTLLVSILIYTYFIWEKSFHRHRLVHKKMHAIHQLSHGINDHNSTIQSEAQYPASTKELDEVISQIRIWHESYIAVINLLPYPIFLEKNGKFVLWNNSASAIINIEKNTKEFPHKNIQSIDQIQHLINEKNLEKNTIEIVINNKKYYILTSFISSTNLNSSTNSNLKLYCLIDSQHHENAILLDKKALRFMAHDLRTPLSTILALIDEKTVESSDDAHFINSLRHQVDYSLRISQGIMQISRAEHLDPDEFTPILLNEVLAEAIEHVRLIAKKKSIFEIELIEIGENNFVLGNHDMLLRVFVNLLDNAIKYSYEAQKIKVEVNGKFHATDKKILIKIIDNGIGIPTNLVEHLFEPFFQVKKSDIHVNGGVGLGLPFVKTVIDKHHGTIYVNSHVKGTEMCIFLPRTVVDATF